jgi:hypothetical protein
MALRQIGASGNPRAGHEVFPPGVEVDEEDLGLTAVCVLDGGPAVIEGEDGDLVAVMPAVRERIGVAGAVLLRVVEFHGLSDAESFLSDHHDWS